MIFNEMDHRLSRIKRWSIVQTIQSQSVAEHCFNVERIAVRIAVQWFGVAEDELFKISQYALHHDDFEAVSGDTPATVKRYFDVERAEKEHADIVKPYKKPPDDLVAIVKLADRLEWYWFLTMEAALGNKYIEDYRLELYGIIHNMAVHICPREVEKVLEAMRSMKPTMRDYKWR